MSESSPPPADLDLGLVRSFITLAEYLHFGRAADALHLTQSSLSRQITRLEQQVGVRLLDRTPRGTELTQAGKVFLPLATATLNSAAHAAARARSAAQPSTLTVGYTMNLVITPAIRELRHRHPELDVRTHYLEWDDPYTALLENRVDAAVARLPFPGTRLRVEPLYDEPRVLLIPRDHRLAGKESATLDDIAHEPMPRTLDPVWDAFWRIDPRPDGSPAPAGPLAETVQDMMELVAGGQAVAVIPASAPIESLRPDLTTVPLEDVEPSHVVLATRAEDHRSLTTAFRSYAAAHLDGYGEPTARVPRTAH
jgi:DNA-binding transcriptional LysR family regulator